MAVGIRQGKSSICILTGVLTLSFRAGLYTQSSHFYLEPHQPSAASSSAGSTRLQWAMRAWQPLTQLSHYGEAAGEMNVAVGSQAGVYQPPDGWECHHPNLASWQGHFLHLHSPISSGSPSTFPLATGCSLVRSVTQLKHTGAQKCELLVSSELPARNRLLRINDISEAAHLDEPFKSHCPHQDTSVLQFLNPTFP